MSRREIRSVKVSEIPASILAAYELRHIVTEIPADITAVVNTHIKTPKAAISRFRDFSSLRSGGAGGKAEDGFQEVRRWGKPHKKVSHESEAFTAISSTLSIVSATEPVSSTLSIVHATEAAPAAPASAPSAVAVVAGVGVYRRPGTHGKSDLELDHGKIRGKLNKINDSNFEKTKDFMKDFLDPSNTIFLTDFVKAVFDTAVMSAVLCKICTRLLHELAGEYPHVRMEMHRLFDDFMLIFNDTIGAPDVSSVDYPKFLEAQSRKRGRRGYSRFIAELVLLKELPVESYITLLKIVTDSLQRASALETNQNECTEYADCLKLLFETPVRPSGEWLSVLVTFAKTPTGELPPGLKPQAKFALMDIAQKLKLM